MTVQDVARARFVALTTFRANGDAVATPVWIATCGGQAYVVSRGRGKVNRIRRNTSVLLARCTMRGTVKGPNTTATARVLDGALPSPVKRAFSRKYGPFPVIGRVLAAVARRELTLLEIVDRDPA